MSDTKFTDEAERADRAAYSDAAAEVRAERKAERYPPEQVEGPLRRELDIRSDNTFREFSKRLANRVLDTAQRAGVPDGEVVAMRNRMRDWYVIVMNYDKEIREMSANKTLPAAERLSLVNQMRDTLRTLRIERFGE